MRALVPDGAGSVELANVAEPAPTETQVLVDVEAVSVNRGETFQLESPPEPRWRPGKDIAGVVTTAASNGTGPPVGTRVVGHAPHSGWAQRVAIDAQRVVPLPLDVAIEDAAALPLAELTALRLARVARLTAGTQVLMTGASGGVGHYFAELASATAADLTAVVSSRARGARLRHLGAKTISSIEEAGQGFDVGMDSIGGTCLAQIRQRVDPSGQVIWFGQASRTPATLDFFDWIHGTTAAPIIQFDYTASERSLGRDLRTLVSLVARGRLHPVLDTIRSFNQAREAIEDLRGRRIQGNLVLKWSTR